MNMSERILRPRHRANHRLPHVPSVALLTASVGVLVCMALVSCSSATTTTDPQATQQAHARASLTAGAQVTQTARVAASQTAAAIPLIPLPYTTAAPGPGCDTGGVPWTAQYTQGVSCLANPSRIRLTAVADATANTSQNEVDWVFGQSGKLPATFQVSVQFSGLLDPTNQGHKVVTLFVNLQRPTGETTSFNVGFGTDGSESNYGIYLDGVETGFVTYDTANLTKPTTIAIELGSDGVHGLINGTTKLTRGAPPPATVTGIALSFVGTAGDYVDFANLRVEQV